MPRSVREDFGGLKVITVGIACLALGACGGVRNPIAGLVSSPVKFAVESFDCETDPGAWPADAPDPVIAGNRRAASATIKDCRQQHRDNCRALEANGQIVGRCEDLPPA